LPPQQDFSKKIAFAILVCPWPFRKKRVVASCADCRNERKRIACKVALHRSRGLVRQSLSAWRYARVNFQKLDAGRD